MCYYVGDGGVWYEGWGVGVGVGGGGRMETECGCGCVTWNPCGVMSTSVLCKRCANSQGDREDE